MTTTGPYGFEEGFFTQEFVGSWVSNNENSRDGSFSIRPPNFASAGTASTELVHNQTHTQLSFWYSARFESIELYIDDVLFDSYQNNISSFTNILISVSAGAHTYRWEVTTADSGTPETYVDDISFQ